MHAGRRYSGNYNLFDLKGFSYPVYCDLTSEPKAAWTLFTLQELASLAVFPYLWINLQASSIQTGMLSDYRSLT